MDNIFSQMLVTLLTVGLGAAGYLMVAFWFQPILRYRKIKYDVAADLIYYANALDLFKDTGEMRPDTQQRKDANRKNAAALESIYLLLPSWYRGLLKRCGENPLAASGDLIGLANSSKRDDAVGYIQGVKTHLKIPFERP
jgi:hypothetical protein